MKTKKPFSSWFLIMLFVVAILTAGVISGTTREIQGCSLAALSIISIFAFFAMDMSRDSFYGKLKSAETNVSTIEANYIETITNPETIGRGTYPSLLYPKIMMGHIKRNAFESENMISALLEQVNFDPGTILTLLFCAVEELNPTILDILLSDERTKIDINQKSEKGHSLLYSATLLFPRIKGNVQGKNNTQAENFIEIISLLVKHGIDCTAGNTMGDTADERTALDLFRTFQSNNAFTADQMIKIGELLSSEAPKPEQIPTKLEQ